MIRALIRLVVFLVSAAIGLGVAALLLDDVTVQTDGFLTAVLLLAAIQSVIAPWVAKVAQRNASFLLGGAGLVATLIALVVTANLTNGLSITGGAVTWISATVVVWLAIGLASIVLPVILVKLGVRGARARRDASA